MLKSEKSLKCLVHQIIHDLIKLYHNHYHHHYSCALDSSNKQTRCTMSLICYFVNAIMMSQNDDHVPWARIYYTHPMNAQFSLSSINRLACKQLMHEKKTILFGIFILSFFQLSFVFCVWSHVCVKSTHTLQHPEFHRSPARCLNGTWQTLWLSRRIQWILINGFRSFFVVIVVFLPKLCIFWQYTTDESYIAMHQSKHFNYYNCGSIFFVIVFFTLILA